MFYLFPTLLGALARVYVPQILVTGKADAAVLLLPSAAIAGVGGQLLGALVAAGAIAARTSGTTTCGTPRSSSWSTTSAAAPSATSRGAAGW
mgnify:CR=1 FL=1